ncbi:MAG: hypothetical protein KUG78_09085 [Kangiellaceae bacterium]|nr:hypothetical protein [Kangiellaceae bacterium]
MQKLTSSLTLIILFAVFAMGWGIDQFFANYSEESDQDVISHYRTIGKQLAVSINAIDNKVRFINQWNSNNQNQLSLTALTNFPLPQELLTKLQAGDSLTLESEDKLSLHYLLVNSEQVLTFIPDELSSQPESSFLSLLLTLLFYFSILIFILIWSYPLIKRLSQLRRSAIQFGEGDLSQRIKLSKTSYINDIESEFNRMANRIESLVTDNKLISSAVSHDLRTPLARLRLGVDVLSETVNPEEREKYQQRLSNDIDEMQSLIEIMLDYAKLEQSLVRVDKLLLNLDSFIDDLFNDFAAGFVSNTELSISVINTNLTVSGDTKYLKMLFRNLLGNGCKYAKSKILVEVVLDHTFGLVRIHDDGVGIEKDQREQVLKPFIKIDSSGYGMGLAIADRIAQWHRGSIQIGESPQLGGAMLEVRIPLEAGIS